MTFRLPESLRRIVEEAPHECVGGSIKERGHRSPCYCWLSRFWAEVAALISQRSEAAIRATGGEL